MNKEIASKISQKMKGRKFTEAHAAAIAQANIRNGAKPVVCSTTGKEYISISEAAREYKVSPAMISKVCHGKLEAVQGRNKRYEFRFSENKKE